MNQQELLTAPKNWLKDLFALAIFLGLFYAIWLGSHALFTPDEGRYSEVAREMVTTGDYITPRLNGVVFLDKPVLYYWLQASAIQLFGLKEWALRFWPAFVGVLGAIITYITGRTLFNRRAGLISAIIVASCPLYYGAAHYANLDLEVAVFIGSSLSLFISAMSCIGRKRLMFLIGAYIFAGLAALTKGMIGIVFPAMIIGSWILLLNRWRTLKEMRLITGLIIFILITLPWYVLVQKANPEFFQFFFVKQQVSRFLTTEHFNNRTPLWFYLPIVLAGVFPWCVFAIQAFSQQIKSVWKNRQNHSAELFLVLWFFLIFIFFSIPKSKTVGYILPIFPAFALIVGNYLSQQWDNVKLSRGSYIGFISFIVLSLSIAICCLLIPHLNLPHFNNAINPYLTINAGLLFIASIVMFFVLKKKQFSKLFLTLVITAQLFLLIITASCGAINNKTIKPLATQLKPVLQQNDEIVAYYKYYQDLPIYLERRITIVADWKSNNIQFNDNWIRELWYGMPFQDTQDWLIGENTFWKRWNSPKRLFVFTNKGLSDELKKKTNIYVVAEYNDTVVISNKKI